MKTKKTSSNIVLLVSCAASKNQLAEPELQMRNVQEDGYDNVLSSWLRSLENVKHRYPAMVLYKGGYWSLIRKILTVQSSWKTLIVSAGLGLVQDTDFIPGYEATFSTNQLDSIPSHQEGSSLWFDGIGGTRRFTEYFEQQSDPLLIVVLSHPYLKAIQLCLDWYIDRFGTDALIVLSTESTKRAFPDFIKSWIVLNEKMVHETGGVVGTLNASVLLWYVSQIGEESISHASMTERIALLSERTASKESLIQKNRTPQTIKQVKQWISRWVQQSLNQNQSIAKTRALREYRQEGFACEQKKFGRLFAEVKADLT